MKYVGQEPSLPPSLLERERGEKEMRKKREDRKRREKRELRLEQEQDVSQS